MKLIEHVLSTSDFLHLDPGVVFMNSCKDGQVCSWVGLTAIWWNLCGPMIFKCFLGTQITFSNKTLHRNSMNFDAIPSTIEP